MSQSPDIPFDRSTPVLRSADYPRSRAFFVDLLGFDVVEEGGEPPRFGIFKRGNAFFFVDAWHGGPTPSPTVWSAYVHVANLQALHDSYAAAGVEISRPVDDPFAMESGWEVYRNLLEPLPWDLESWGLGPQGSGRSVVSLWQGR